MKTELEKITAWWMEREGLSLSEARKMAIEEIDFYYEDDEKPVWKGPNDSIQNYL